MTSKYHSRRSARKLAGKAKRNFFLTLIIILGLLYTTITWILPTFINGIGFVKDKTNPVQRKTPESEDASVAPPVLNIPYEATNSSQIDIKGFGTPETKVKLYLDDELVQTIDVDRKGNFIFEKVELSIGTNNIYGKSLDERDKESLPSKIFKLIYENDKPPLSINEPEDEKKIQGGAKQIKVSGKTDTKVNVFINNTQVIVDKDGNFNTDQILNDGDNTFTVKAQSQAGNITEIQRKVIYSP